MKERTLCGPILEKKWMKTFLYLRNIDHESAFIVKISSKERKTIWHHKTVSMPIAGQ